MQIIIDSREQQPFNFSHEEYETITISGALNIGDYSLVGLTDKVAVERKSLADLVMCLGRERERFKRELLRSRGLESFAVVVESSWADLKTGQYRSKLNAHSACQSVLAFMSRYRVPFFFAGNKSNAEYVTWGFLKQYLEGLKKNYKTIIKQADITI